MTKAKAEVNHIVTVNANAMHHFEDGQEVKICQVQPGFTGKTEWVYFAKSMKDGMVQMLWDNDIRDVVGHIIAEDFSSAD